MVYETYDGLFGFTYCALVLKHVFFSNTEVSNVVSNKHIL